MPASGTSGSRDHALLWHVAFSRCKGWAALVLLRMAKLSRVSGWESGRAWEFFFTAFFAKGDFVMYRFVLLCILLTTVFIGAEQTLSEMRHGQSPVSSDHAERHLKNVRQLTFGRQNAEAYFSFDGTKLIFQSTNNWMKDSFAATLKPAEEGLGCYQMYVMDLESESIRLVSTGTGATTCGYFFPGDRRVLYSSTYASGPNCPPKPKRDGAYRWALDDYDLYAVRIDGQEMQRLTATPGYDAEATVSPDGKTIVWTSVKDGDLDLYAMNLDGTKPRRLTDEVGYDGGAFFSADSKRIVYRASHPTNPDEVSRY